MENYQTEYLYPSTIIVSDTLLHIQTILGSCISVCLYDQYLRVGGMNHYMLPYWNGEGLASPKYGNIAIEKTIEKLNKLGVKNYNLRAKVFGGAEVLNQKMNSSIRVGQRNIEIAFKILDDYNIPVIAADTGGYSGRKIRFNAISGEVLMKYVSKELQYVQAQAENTICTLNGRKNKD